MKFLCRFVGALTLAVVALSSADAKAAPVIQTFSCNQGIAFISYDGGGLYIDCVGQPNRFAAFSFSPCTGVPGNIDNIKLFQAIATSAMLSGKQLNIWYATPASCQGTFGMITTLQLQR
jgi:hypothetical protein